MCIYCTARYEVTFCDLIDCFMVSMSEIQSFQYFFFAPIFADVRIMGHANLYSLNSKGHG